MKRRVGWILAAAWLGLAFTGRAAASGDLVRRIVVFSQETSRADRMAIARTAGANIVRELWLINAVVIEGQEAQVQSAENSLKDRPEVLLVDEDPEVKWLPAAAPALVTDIPLPDVKAVIKPFHPAADGVPGVQKRDWGVERVKAPAAWAKTRGEGVKVVVIDTGIDINHPDLKENIVGGWNTVNDSPNFKDDNGHGSHVSGIIAAVDNNEGSVGVAPKASLYGVKVLNAEGSGTYDNVIAGMQWAVENKMQVANMSLGGSRGTESLRLAVSAMTKAGVVLMAAAGNSGGAVSYPGAYKDEGAITIAASNSANKVAWFSSRGPAVAFIAPGVNIYSTYWESKSDGSSGSGYDTLSGTSMATPHMVGLAALAIKAKNITGSDEKVVQAVRAALKAAASPLSDEIPVEQQGSGIVDAGKLVNR
ncbi:MAG: S8 family peptidase [Elusimicrobia bacterium]|nr:S8 family peptidase [Elusimicrobiota bacterium]